MVGVEDVAVVGAVFAVPVGVAVASVLYGVQQERYRVRLAEIEDDTEPFTVPVLAFPRARIVDYFPKEPQEPGTSVTVTISVTNVGLVSGTIWCYVDGDYSLPKKEYSIRKGGTYNFIWTGAFTMPSRDVNLTAHAGHYE